VSNGFGLPLFLETVEVDRQHILKLCKLWVVPSDIFVNLLRNDQIEIELCK